MLMLMCAAESTAAQTPEDTPEPSQHEFIVKNYKRESGAVLPEARLVYGQYGELNAAGDNAILLPSHYMADMHGHGWLIGPGKALDPKKYLLITMDA